MMLFHIYCTGIEKEKPIIEEVKEKIMEEVQLPGSEIEGTLRLARERYKSELISSRDYHRALALHFEESGDNQLALRQRILSEIYQSTLDRA